MRRVLHLFPTEWDERQLVASRPAWFSRYEPVLASPRDADAYDWRLDLERYAAEIAERERGRIHGVTSSSDYPGIAAAAIVAERLSLPGTPVRDLLLAQHKHAARETLARAIPDASPWHALVDAIGRTPLPDTFRFPCIVKPVKGAFSVLVRRLGSREELERFLADERTQDYARHHGRMFDRLLAARTDCHVDTAHFVAEEILTGDLVTVEGFARRGAITMIGVTDSVLHARSGSFARFDYPSRLPAPVQARLEDVAGRAARALGIAHGLFNAELFHDAATGRIGIVEVNARIAGQFADLHEKVDGTSTCEIALALAADEPVRWRPRAGRYACAASRPLRTFERCRVARAPDGAAIAAAEALHEGTLVWSDVRTGDVLDDLASEDGASLRYAVVNAGARTHEELLARLEDVERALDFRLDPLAG